MAAARKPDPDAPESRVFRIARSFDIPKTEMWKVWTEADRLKHWWGPKGFKVTHCTVDLRVGGNFHYCIKPANGPAMWGRFVYTAIAAPDRLVFISSFSDEKGGVTRHPMAETWPLQMLTLVTFEGKDNRTTVTVNWSTFEATDIERKTFEDAIDSIQGGWGGTFDQLGQYLAGR